MLRLSKILVLMLAVSFGLASCKKEEKVDPTEDNEVITTITLQLTNKSNASETVTATVDDLNKDKPNLTAYTLNLKANTTYLAKVILSDKTKIPALDISAAIKTEQNEHLFVYTVASDLNLIVKITDQDTNNPPLPLGLETEFTTTSASSGKLNVILRHQPNSKNGASTPGTTDLDTDFNVVIN